MENVTDLQSELSEVKMKLSVAEQVIDLLPVKVKNGLLDSLDTFNMAKKVAKADMAKKMIEWLENEYKCWEIDRSFYNSAVGAVKRFSK